MITTPATPLLRLRGITKRFGDAVVLNGVDFDLHAGEIHALLGENGAGKSTLIKILGGIHQPDAGEILLDEKQAEIYDVVVANQLGIRLIHQELSLAPNLSVGENIFLGREPLRCGLIDRRQLFCNAERLCDELGMTEIGDVQAHVSDLKVAQQQMVEIVRALSVNARILVLDEPTASLSETETESLFVILNRLREQGVGIIYISHRLGEIQRLADRVTVLRDGASIGTQESAEINQAELIRWMVGRDIPEQYERKDCKPGAVALSVQHLCNAWVHDVSFEIRYGEILGFAGLVGAGRTELARALFGVEPAESGEILVEGRLVNIKNPGDALSAGIVLVPEDRKREGLVMTGSVAFNLALPMTHEWNKDFRPDAQRRAEIVSRGIRGFNINCSNQEQAIESLSGGNQQKVVVAKWMEKRPKVLILDEPTRGVDVGAREEMFGIIRKLTDAGMAVLLISSDLPEVMRLSHRLVLYRDGQIIHEATTESITAEEIMAQLTRN